MNWRNEAACRGEDIDTFYPLRGETSAPAKAICASCPVRVECMDYGVAHEGHGVYGGKSERQRRQMRANLRIPLTRPEKGVLLGWLTERSAS